LVKDKILRPKIKATIDSPPNKLPIVIIIIDK